MNQDFAVSAPRPETRTKTQPNGVGGAVATGYKKWCRDREIDVAVVMAGDTQMDPADLLALLDPVVADEVDYAKGNRLPMGDEITDVPESHTA